MSGDFRGEILTANPAHKALWDDIRASASSLGQLLFFSTAYAIRLRKVTKLEPAYRPSRRGFAGLEGMLRGIQVMAPEAQIRCAIWKA